ncbi:hypothetical protein GDO86_008945 [Hymenochirus boettgeri]|uniref:Uncharacterized protein n=1 Tax=Hymenochirus boettgeri TaxID=247094 RepID=A0A8T2J7P7_9PIPI|nr:hypothetical protein GDO86_008945 [Hymenochirus boettgeri]
MNEQEKRERQNFKAKKEAQEQNQRYYQTLAADDKRKEQRRLDHLRNVREKIDKKEYEKCAANERKEISIAESQRRRVDNHYRHVAEKVFQAEQEIRPQKHNSPLVQSDG